MGVEARVQPEAAQVQLESQGYGAACALVLRLHVAET